MTGDVTTRFRPRLVSRQRLDAVDADAMSRVATLYGDFMDRALISKTYATAAQAVGEIWTGGSVTPNPIGANDGLLRVNSELFVGLDSDGHVVLKPNSITLQVAVPVGTNQVYIYDNDVSTKTAVKRFITAIAPFTEITQATDTEFEGVANVYIRAGNAGTIIPDTVIGGRTVPLIFLGIATNVAGAVTWDQSAAVNRLSTCPGAPTLPSDNSHNGSMANLVDMSKALLWLASRIKWKGSTHFTPSATNNYGAYQDPIQGLDVTYRETLGWVTIGDGVSAFGDFDQTQFASDDLLLQAAINALPALGGTIVIKPGVLLTNINGPVLVLKSVFILGSGPVSLLNFTATGIMATITSKALRLKSVVVSGVGNCIQIADGSGGFIAEDCAFYTASPVTTSLIVMAGGGTGISGISIRNCYFNGTVAADSHTIPVFISGSNTPISDMRVESCVFTMNTHIGIMVYLQDIRANVKFVNCDFRFETDSMVLTDRGMALLLGSASNGDAGDVRGRLIQGCSFQGNLTDANNNFAFAPIQGWNQISHLTIDDCTFLRCTSVVIQPGSTEWSITNCRFIKTWLNSPSVFFGDNAIRNLVVRGCLFQNTGVQIFPQGDVTNMLLDGCRFKNNGGFSLLSPIDVRPVQGIIANLKITRCLIEGEAFQSSVRIETQVLNGYSITGFEFSDNEMSGFSSTITDNIVLGFNVRTYLMSGTKVRGNTFRDMQNVIYNGTGNDNGVGGFRVIEFAVDQINGLTFDGNQFYNVAKNYIPAAGKKICSGHYLRITAVTGGAFTHEWDNIIITGNVFGDAGCRCNPLIVDGGKVADAVQNDLRTIRITNNIITYSYPPGTELFPWIGDMQIKFNGTGQPTIVIDGNTFNVNANPLGLAQRNMIEINGPRASLLQITGNKFNTSSFDFTNGWGVGSSGGIAVDELVFCKNVGSRFAGLIGTHGMTTLDGSIPAVPGAGVNWTDNIKFVNN